MPGFLPESTAELATAAAESASGDGDLTPEDDTPLQDEAEE